MRTGRFNDCVPNRRIFRRLGALLALSAVLLASGLHTVAMQSYCWAKMFDVYNEFVSVPEAVEMTLSGQDLCGVCILSEETQKSMVASLELSVNGKIQLVRTAQPSIIKRVNPPARLSYRFDFTPNYQEIKLAFDPPPPRAA